MGVLSHGDQGKVFRAPEFEVVDLTGKKISLSVFNGKEFVRFSPALTPDIFDVQAVEAVMYSAAKRMEQGNFFDGADKFKDLFAAEVDPTNPEWVRIYAPGSPPINNHVIAGQIGPVSV